MIFYPPKPTLITITQALFSELELDPRFIAELKYNGDRLILYKDNNFDFWSRHGAPLRKYQPSAQLIDHLNSLNLFSGSWVFDGELLHFKTKAIKHRVVLFDLYVWKGKRIDQLPFSERRKRLEDVFTGSNFEDVILAPQWLSGWREVFDTETEREEIEGLVMKRLDAKVTFGRSSSPVVSYMFKVRKPGKSKSWRY